MGHPSHKLIAGALEPPLKGRVPLEGIELGMGGSQPSMPTNRAKHRKNFKWLYL
ncbi:hypothetical protein MA16_Dca007962 [Dendrobium catenatum]|uniref:Uncharacterized protein n=1 Tax=Dendrobium catenatum TaxID=906689 RepID=A0A2I0XJD6_9ASPA|nr:hypothetical protein MA16_Dca007962 [Dendrobium catenatum]